MADKFDRLSVNLIPKSSADLASLMDRTGLSKTDVVNRAIQLYEWVSAETVLGGDLVLRRDGEQFLVRLL